MKKSLYIIGAGGLGREVYALIQSLSDWAVSGYFDDGVKEGELIMDAPVVGGLHALINWAQPIHVVVAIGNPQTKLSIVKKLEACNHIYYPTLVHPSAVILDKERITLAEGVIVSAGCILTTHIHVSQHVLLNLNCTIGHDTTIGRCSSIMPGVNIAGQVTIGEGVLIGSGANVKNNVRIGDTSRVGMGAVVLTHVPADITVAGVPAKKIG